MNRTCWVVVTLGEKKNCAVFHFSLASVVKITCTSTSLVNCEAFSSFCTDSFLENLIDECSHCKLLSKSTIWTSIQLSASRKEALRLDVFWKNAQFLMAIICFSRLLWGIACHFHLSVHCLFVFSESGNLYSPSFYANSQKLSFLSLNWAFLWL